MKVLYLLVILLVVVGLCLGGKDYYEVLGVSRDSSPSEIKRAYRKLSLQYHPDKNPTPEGQEKFLEMTKVYETLSDSEKRRIYDQHGEEGLNRQNGGGGQDFGDFFSNIFRGFGGGGGGGHQQQHQAQPRGADIELDLEVTLKDLYLGRTSRVTHMKQILCQKCRGTGAKKASDVKTCTGCQGSGIKVRVQQLGPGFVQQVQQVCDECGGKGKKVASKCPHCSGKKVEIGEETYTVIVEKGMHNGQQIKLDQLGEESPDMTPGDVIFRIVEIPHSKFRREGDHLHHNLSITLLEALTGFDKTITHLDKHNVRVQSGDITIPGQVIEVLEEGMPHHQYPSQMGNLYVHITVDFPKDLTNDQKEPKQKSITNNNNSCLSNLSSIIHTQF
ncbi:heat shock protein DnaJ family protein [Cavenderia fasciculata]|uniref:Heat shock protein DnaJ family protein n=1 Tax=Cavenderia fasciculata TaxID=261658 RepID=F4PTE5_CACFS|nr:heat shock protein DnaJ family protein [Cavenderia fasciculata]EGG21667.1 heat shock protein DnaJ family protein [Cavenderia fasciculata]|eukprot:XP_004359517.1 heat shock protein DnaJ family protein [Cavenderia fasciculata]